MEFAKRSYVIKGGDPGVELFVPSADTGEGKWVNAAAASGGPHGSGSSSLTEILSSFGVRFRKVAISSSTCL
jgi:hypothetical protein